MRPVISSRAFTAKRKSKAISSVASPLLSFLPAEVIDKKYGSMEGLLKDRQEGR